MSRNRLSSIQISAMDSIMKCAGQHQEIILQRLQLVDVMTDYFSGKPKIEDELIRELSSGKK